MKTLLVLVLAVFGLSSVQASPAAPDVIARFKHDCFEEKGKLRPAENHRWVCFLPNGSLRVSD